MVTFLFLVCMSLIAGILTGIIGMASLTLYPVLLSIGIAPVTANATVTVAQVGAGAGAILSSIKELKGHWKQAWLIAVLNTVGGIFGALILIHTSNAKFQKLVPVFILVDGILMLIPVNTNHAKHNGRVLHILSMVCVLLIGIYNGFFGAASGLLMIALLYKIIGNEYRTYNAMRNLASLCNNIVASIIFIIQIPIAWTTIPVMLVGLFIGGYIGPIIVRLIPLHKLTVGIFATGLACVMGYITYF